MEVAQLDKLDKDQFAQEDREEAKEMQAERMAEETAKVSKRGGGGRWGEVR